MKSKSRFNKREDMRMETTKKVPRFEKVLEIARKKTIKLYYFIALNYESFSKLNQIDKTTTNSVSI